MLFRASTHRSPASIGNPQEIHFVVNSSFQSKQSRYEDIFSTCSKSDLLHNREVRPQGRMGSWQIFCHSRHTRSTLGRSWCPWLSSSSKEGGLGCGGSGQRLVRDLIARISVFVALFTFFTFYILIRLTGNFANKSWLRDVSR